MFASAASTDEFEGSQYVLQADRHWRSAAVRVEEGYENCHIIAPCGSRRENVQPGRHGRPRRNVDSTLPGGLAYDGRLRNQTPDVHWLV